MGAAAYNRAYLASARSENIRNSLSIPPILGVYPDLISDVNELAETTSILIAKTCRRGLETPWQKC
jgi:hypothetical protein